METFALLRALPEDAQAQVKAKLICETHATGTVLHSPDGGGERVYFLVSGTALAVNTPSQLRSVIFESLNAGDIFGELSALDSEPCPMEVIATSTCQVCSLSQRDFASLIIKHEYAVRDVLRAISAKVRRAYDRIESLCALTAEQRVCEDLLNRAIADPTNKNRVRVFPVPTQQEIANTVGTTRQTVARVFGKLIRDKVIERRGQVLIFLDPEQLEREAQPQKAT